MNLGAGWLPRDPTFDLPAAVFHGVVVPRMSAGTSHDPAGAVFPTRIEEYGWVVQQLTGLAPSKILSAGAGMNPEIHVLEYIMANMGHTVVAVDADATSLQMPAHVGVERVLGDIARLDYGDAQFDLWVCVSVVEHMSEDAEKATYSEAFRVLRPGGYALLTTDHTDPVVMNARLAAAGFLTGPVEPFAGTPLEPPVSYVIAQRPL